MTAGVKVYPIEDAVSMKNIIDVAILCGGSAVDLPVQTPQYARLFNVVDSFDNHANINDHYHSVDQAAKAAGKIGIISVGWDPGLFSLNRLISYAISPQGKTYTFWGRGVSQGHSDAIRRIKGVKDGKQYTIPVEAALESVRAGKNPVFSPRDKHFRECFVVTEDGADIAAIEYEIKNMPNYFSDYDTTVHFITEDQMLQDHSGIPHGGFIIHTGNTGANRENKHVIEYNVKLDSNPEFTASILAAYARAAYRLNMQGETGCRTIFDIAPGLLSKEDAETLRAQML